MADRIVTVPAVRGTACCPVTCLVPGVEDLFDLPVRDVVLAVDAVGVDGEQHGEEVASHEAESPQPGPTSVTLPDGDTGDAFQDAHWPGGYLAPSGSGKGSAFYLNGSKTCFTATGAY